MTLDVWPTQATFRPGQPVCLRVEDGGAVTVEVSHLGRLVRNDDYDVGPGAVDVELGVFPTGGYAVLARAGNRASATTAFDVLDSPMQRPRYGFLSEFGPDRHDAGVTIDGLLRLHLNVVQFYDWMYRHAQLLAEDDEFDDALDRRTSHAVTRELVRRVAAAGAAPLGYAAVYGAGADYAKAHPDQLLYHADGTPWMLGDFLWIADPGPLRGWRAHIVDQLRSAVDAMGFAGLHLDQYGAPKTALDAAGVPVELAERFPGFIAAVREALPEATLIFNNVNDYPTWATAAAPLDATYVEVWPPHTTYAHLSQLVACARAHAPARPVILAAYLRPFANDDPDRAAWAARLAMATVFAHGGHYLLCGEGDGVLTDPYYPNFRRVDAGALAVLRAYHDHAVALGDLLYDPTAVDVTRSHWGGVNDDIEVVTDLPVSCDPQPQHLWVIARHGSLGLTVHIIDLVAQQDVEWNRGKTPGPARRDVRLRVRHLGPEPQVGTATPEAGPMLRAAPARRLGDHIEMDIPPFRAWAVIHIGAAAAVEWAT